MISSKSAAIIFTAFLYMFILSLNAIAEQVSYIEMDRVAKNWLVKTVFEKGAWANDSRPTITSSRDITDNGQLLARYYEISPSGYIVVPILRELPPVLVFSEDSRLGFNEEYGPAALITQLLKDRTNRFTELYGSLEATIPDDQKEAIDRQTAYAWNLYTLDEDQFSILIKRKSSPREQVGPLLSTVWHQTYPYNQYCPMGDGDQCVVWCVATALAQILWYHQWPPAGFGHTNYQWNGDQSCGGSTPGLYLTANFSDRYEYIETTENAAEICVEVGKAYHVDYGVCYSIGYVSPIFDFLPDNFGYMDDINQIHRNQHSAEEWFALVQEEINNNRPIEYLIFNHMIVADGWATGGSIKYYHINFGWGGSHNAWFAVDNIYCGWEGCDPMVEVMFTNIRPDRSLMFFGDTIVGQTPLEINFTATSDADISEWVWDFGDGDSEFVQSPTHIYNDPGIYDVTLAADTGDLLLSKTRTEYIYVLGDEIYGTDARAYPGEKIQVSILVDNMIPLSKIVIPIEYNGPVGLTLDSFSTDDCVSESFQGITVIDSDPESKRLSLQMIPWISGYSEYPFLPAGTGEILKLYFSVDSGALPSETTPIVFDGYENFQPLFIGSIHGQEHDYLPTPTPGYVYSNALCGDANNDEGVNILDISYLIAYLYLDGPPPVFIYTGDVNKDNNINILDISYLIAYLYQGGPAPDCPPAKLNY